MTGQTIRKHSRQRDAILVYLMSRKDHPTADMVYQNIRNTIPNISLGTVYRNLSLLSESGEITRLSCDGKVDRFDADTRPHYHFMCRKCGCVSDLLIPYADNLNREAAKDFDGTILDHSTIFTGYCKNCKEELSHQEKTFKE